MIALQYVSHNAQAINVLNKKLHDSKVVDVE